MHQLCTAYRNVIIKYVGPVVIYEIMDPHNYLLMTLDGKILRGLFEHERLKPAKNTNESRECKQSNTFKTSYKHRNESLNK